MIKANVARQYRDKYGMEMPTLKLARIMYEENNLTFKNVEDCRDTLRRIEGKHGSNKNDYVKQTKYYMPEARPKNPYNLPESHQEKRQPFKLPTACNNILLISDLHIPYHDIDAINLAIKYGVENKINTIFINGDLIDNHQVSRFEKDPRKRSVKQEFDATKQFLRSLRAVFPDAHIYWLKGNHCVRWEKFLLQKAAEIWDDPYFHLEERLQLNEERVHLLDDKVLVKAGKLSITHGHKVYSGSAGSPAKSVFNKMVNFSIIGHLHRRSTNQQITDEGQIISTWTTGCLCDLRPDYNAITSQSVHGFAHVVIDKAGNPEVKNFYIENNKLRL